MGSQRIPQGCSWLTCQMNATALGSWSRWNSSRCFYFPTLAIYAASAFSFWTLGDACSMILHCCRTQAAWIVHIPSSLPVQLSLPIAWATVQPPSAAAWAAVDETLRMTGMTINRSVPDLKQLTRAARAHLVSGLQSRCTQICSSCVPSFQSSSLQVHTLVAATTAWKN